MSYKTKPFNTEKGIWTEARKDREEKDFTTDYGNQENPDNV